MKYTRYLLCCLVLYLSSVPRPGESAEIEGTSPLPPSGVVSTLLSLKNLLIFVSHYIARAAASFTKYI